MNRLKEEEHPFCSAAKLQKTICLQVTTVYFLLSLQLKIRFLNIDA